MAPALKVKNLKTEVLVIGSGAAGLNFARNMAEKKEVTVVTKKALLSSNTNYAQGGIAAVINPDDDFELHIKDTLKTGRGLCDENAVRIMVEEAPKQIVELLRIKVPFTKKGNVLSASREAGHSRARIIYSKDRTGRAIEKALIRQIKENSRIRVFEKTVLFELLVRNGRCAGALCFDAKTNSILAIHAKATVLATGGAARLYLYSTNPAIATGDGLAAAFRAGAELEDLEFVQFHPTMLDVQPNPNFLISETLRGEGGRLYNSRGERFMKKHSSMLELAPRDVVARAIMQERKRGKVYLDIRHLGSSRIKERFPTIYRRCLKHGIDITKERIPVIPAAHYMCGGVSTDTEGRTTLKGLYAFGEVARTGVHGANRLASNSLLESLVFSERAFRAVLKDIEKQVKTDGRISKSTVEEIVAERDARVIALIRRFCGKTKPAEPGRRSFAGIKWKVRKVMWEKAGIVRTQKGLEEAARELAELTSTAYQARSKALKTGALSKQVLEASMMPLSAFLIALAARERKESRGTHFVAEFPGPARKWEKRHVCIKLSRKPVRTCS